MRIKSIRNRITLKTHVYFFIPVRRIQYSKVQGPNNKVELRPVRPRTNAPFPHTYCIFFRVQSCTFFISFIVFHSAVHDLCQRSKLYKTGDDFETAGRKRRGKLSQRKFLPFVVVDFSGSGNADTAKNRIIYAFRLQSAKIQACALFRQRKSVGCNGPEAVVV